MEKYITRQPITVQKLVCSHPQVKYFWEYGGMSQNANSEPYVCVAMLLIDGSRHEFKSDNQREAVYRAEQFLQSLPQK